MPNPNAFVATTTRPSALSHAFRITHIPVICVVIQFTTYLSGGNNTTAIYNNLHWRSVLFQLLLDEPANRTNIPSPKIVLLVLNHGIIIFINSGSVCGCNIAIK
jgi:hypothetical protein